MLIVDVYTATYANVTSDQFLCSAGIAKSHEEHRYGWCYYSVNTYEHEPCQMEITRQSSSSCWPLSECMVQGREHITWDMIRLNQFAAPSVGDTTWHAIVNIYWIVLPFFPNAWVELCTDQAKIFLTSYPCIVTNYNRTGTYETK